MGRYIQQRRGRRKLSASEKLIMPVDWRAQRGAALQKPGMSALQGAALRSNLETAELKREGMQQEIDMAPGIEARQQQETNLKIKKFLEDASEKDRETFIDASAAGLAAEERGEDGAFAFNAALGWKEGQEKAPWDPRTAQVLIDADAEEFRMQSRKGDRTAQKFIDSDGKPVQGSIDDEGRYWDSSGNQRTDITPIAPQAGQADIQGGGPGDKPTDRLTSEVLGGAENLISSIDRISEQIKEMPQSALGLPGSAAVLVDNVVSASVGFSEQLGGWAQVNGQDVEEGALLDARLYQEVFSGPAAQNAALQANSIGLAYALARSANPDGRISDADVRHQLQRIKLDKSSKTQIQAAIKEVRLSVLTNVANHLRVYRYTDTTKGKESYDKYMKEIDKLSPQPETGDGDAPEGVDQAIWDEMTPEERAPWAT